MSRMCISEYLKQDLKWKFLSRDEFIERLSEHQARRRKNATAEIKAYNSQAFPRMKRTYRGNQLRSKVQGLFPGIAKRDEID